MLKKKKVKIKTGEEQEEEYKLKEKDSILKISHWLLHADVDIEYYGLYSYWYIFTPTFLFCASPVYHLDYMRKTLVDLLAVISFCIGTQYLLDIRLIF